MKEILTMKIIKFIFVFLLILCGAYGVFSIAQEYLILGLCIGVLYFFTSGAILCKLIKEK